MMQLFRWTTCFFRLGLALLLLVAAISKTLDPTGFAGQIGDFGIVPAQWNKAAAILILVIEVAVALGLLMDQGWALMGVIVLLTAFIGVLIYGVAMGLDIECGCYGDWVSLSLRQAILIDTLLLFVSIGLAVGRRTLRQLAQKDPTL